MHIFQMKLGKSLMKEGICIFLGYIKTSKACRLYNPITKKFLVSRDVKFEEENPWNDKKVENYVPVIHSYEQKLHQRIVST